MNHYSEVPFDQLIPAKTSIPHQHKRIIKRPRLFSILETCFSHRLTLVSAPAGYGKTTLVSEWLSRQRYPVAWLSLSKEDNHIPVFLSYLSAAFSPINSSIGNCIHEFSHLEGSVNFQDLMKSLLMEMEKASPALIMVLDDYHLIQNQQIHELMQFLLQNRMTWASSQSSNSRGCHPIIISRNDPPFPISKWRIYQEINEIRSHDLRFSRNEAEAFYRDSFELNPDQVDINRITLLTEGWVTGMQLTALTLNSLANHQQNIELSEIRVNNQLLAGYMMEEVILDLPAAMQQFLMQTSILEHLTADLCNHIRGQQDSQKILDWLVQRNLFIIPMDGQQGWYRYHQLFLDVLVQRQHLLDQELIKEYHIRAAEWLGEKCYFQKSMNHWLAAGNVSETVQLMVKAAPYFLDTSQFLLLYDLFKCLPEEACYQNPWMCIYRAWTHSILLESSYMHWIRQAIEATESDLCRRNYSQAEILEMQGNIYTIQALQAARLDEIENTIKFSEKALNLLPDKAISVRGMVQIAKAKVYFHTGDMHHASSLFVSAGKILEEGGNYSGAADAIYLTGKIFHLKGKLNAAYQAYHDALTLLKTHMQQQPAYEYVYLSGAGLLELEWNHLDRAEEYLRKGYENRFTMNTHEKATVCAAYLEFLIRVDQLQRADDVIKEIEILCERAELSMITRSELQGALLKYYAFNRDIRIADRIVSENMLESLTPGDYAREAELIGLAYYYWKAGQSQPLKRLVETLIPVLEAGSRLDRYIQINMIHAIALFEMGDLQNAVRYYSNALSSGLREGYLFTYASFDQPVMRLNLALSYSGDLEPSYCLSPSSIEKISAIITQRKSVKQAEEIPSQQQTRFSMKLENQVEPLTAQEFIVLKLMAGGKNNKAIAGELHLSNNTVKTHIMHIYKKLDAHNRVEVVYKAKVLEILE